MTYLAARIELLKNAPPIPLKMIAIEVATLLAVAGLMVLLFA